MTKIDDSWVQAYWYACGYNDHRDQLVQDYVDANEFAMHWQNVSKLPSRPSMHEVFKEFLS